MEFHTYLGFDHTNNLNTEDVKGKIAKKNLEYLFEDGIIIFQGNLFEKGETIVWINKYERG